jgi:predicted  nucleic acid-binding Zn-ribbon protein
MSDLTPIVIPVVVSVILSLTAAFAVARYSGPAQEAYVKALTGRLQVVERERDDAEMAIPKLEARIEALEKHVHELQQQLAERDRELVILYQRLSADEKRIPREPRR